MTTKTKEKTKKFNLKTVKTGSKFEAVIDGKKCTGRIFNDINNKCIYFCQNKADGSDSPNKLGYRYSWIRDYDQTDIQNGSQIISITPPEKGFKEPFLITFAGYYPEIKKGYVKFGCQKVKNSDIKLLVKHLIN